MEAEPQVDAPAADAPGRRSALRDRLRADHDRLLRRLCYLLFAVIVVGYCLIWGVPTKRGVLIAFVLALLLMTCIGKDRRAVVRMLVDWLPFAAVLLLYDQTRRLGGRLGVPVHEADIARGERWLFGGTDPTVWLQAHLHPDAAVHWYDAACTLVYTSHFVATPVIAAVLWLVARDAFLRFITRIVFLSVAALITYMLFPAAPPWLASQNGHLGPVRRLSAEGWVWLHAGNINSLLARAQDAGSNPVAAMPSVHTATATLVAIALASLLTTRWKWLLALYPVAMGFALVYDGEHYVLDVLVGVVYALAVHAGVTVWERRRAARGLGPYDYVPARLAESQDPVRTPQPVSTTPA